MPRSPGQSLAGVALPRRAPRCPRRTSWCAPRRRGQSSGRWPWRSRCRPLPRPSRPKPRSSSESSGRRTGRGGRTSGKRSENLKVLSFVTLRLNYILIFWAFFFNPTIFCWNIKKVKKNMTVKCHYLISVLHGINRQWTFFLFVLKSPTFVLLLGTTPTVLTPPPPPFPPPPPRRWSEHSGLSARRREKGKSIAQFSLFLCVCCAADKKRFADRGNSFQNMIYRWRQRFLYRTQEEHRKRYNAMLKIFFARVGGGIHKYSYNRMPNI